MKTHILCIETKVNKCFCCEKDLFKDEHNTIYDAGYAELAFHFGSTLDQCHGFAGRKDDKETPLDKILASDMIELYICDDCFKKKHHLCNGYDDMRIDYSKMKKEQFETMKEIATWLQSDEGKKEFEEGMAYVRAKEKISCLNLKKELDACFEELTRSRNHGMVTTKLQERFDELNRQWKECLVSYKADYVEDCG